MPIGNSFDLPEYNKEEEKLVKLGDKVQEWWDNLNEQEQYNLMLNWYPEAIEEDTDIDKFFGDMPDREQLEIYEKETK